MATYLLFIGLANALGVVLLVAALDDGLADKLLRRWTFIIPPHTPFAHSRYSRIWLWWAIIGTCFYAFINLAAASWPEQWARFIVYGNVFVYLAFEGLAIAASVSGRYGRGILVSHILWLAQAAWGVMVLA